MLLYDIHTCRHTYIHARMHACINTHIQIYKYRDIQIYKYTNIQIYKHSDIQICKYTNIQICTEIQIYANICKYTNIRILCKAAAATKQDGTLASTPRACKVSKEEVEDYSKLGFPSSVGSFWEPRIWNSSLSGVGFGKILTCQVPLHLRVCIGALQTALC